jgi:hypothetical protein
MTFLGDAMCDNEKVEELTKLLREAKRLGLSFSVGSCTIRRAFIVQQEDLVRRIDDAMRKINDDK